MTLLRCATLLCTSLALVPSAAHLFELPGKMSLRPGDYFMVQSIYAGWAWFGVPIFFAVVANLLLAVRLRHRDGVAARAAAAASALIAISVVVFFVWVFPANQATLNWTVASRGWERLRPAWEYGHAFNGAILLAALALSIAACVRQPSDR
jgi:hypothetical protein